MLQRVVAQRGGVLSQQNHRFSGHAALSLILMREQQSLKRDSDFGALDQAVSRFGLGWRFKAPPEAALGMIPPGLEQRRQSLLQAHVPQGEPVEFLLRPGNALRLKNRTAHHQRLRFVQKSLAGFGAQFIHPNVFNTAQSHSSRRTAASTSAALAQTAPIGSPKRSAALGSAIYERFDQHGLDGVTLLPVMGHPLQEQAVSVRSQIATTDPRTNQKARQSYHLKEIRFAGWAVPSNPSVAAGQMKGRGTHPEGANDSLRAADQIA